MLCVILSTVSFLSPLLVVGGFDVLRVTENGFIDVDDVIVGVVTVSVLDAVVMLVLIVLLFKCVPKLNILSLSFKKKTIFCFFLKNFRNLVFFYLVLLDRLILHFSWSQKL